MPPRGSSQTPPAAQQLSVRRKLSVLCRRLPAGDAQLSASGGNYPPASPRGAADAVSGQNLSAAAPIISDCAWRAPLRRVRSGRKIRTRPARRARSARIRPIAAPDTGTQRRRRSRRTRGRRAARSVAAGAPILICCRRARRCFRRLRRAIRNASRRYANGQRRAAERDAARRIRSRLRLRAAQGLCAGGRQPARLPEEISERHACRPTRNIGWARASISASATTMPPSRSSTVTTKFDRQPKAPDALLRLGQSLAALGEKETACAAWGEISRKYARASGQGEEDVAAEQKRVRC